MRIGLGFDIHRVRAGKKGSLRLGGILIPAPYRVIAHSDGDIVLHALSDAILSALGAGDIGEKFPKKSAAGRGMDSKKILAYALKEARMRSMIVANASIVLAAEKPKLAPHREKITSSLTKLLGLEKGRAGLTFKTFEGLPGIASKAIACWATCLLEEDK